MSEKLPERAANGRTALKNPNGAGTASVALPQDAFAAEIVGEIATPFGSSWGENRNGLGGMRHSSPPSDPTSDGRELRHETGLGCKFKATVRFAAPAALPTPASRVVELPEVTVSAENECGHAAGSTTRPEHLAIECREWLNGIADAVFLLDPNDPSILGPIVQCDAWRDGPSEAREKSGWSLSWPVIDCNESAIQQYGYSREELIGRPAGLVGPRTDHPGTLETLLPALRRHHRGRIQGVAQRKNGAPGLVEVSYGWVRWFGRELILSIHRELTEPVRLEAATAKLDTRLTRDSHGPNALKPSSLTHAANNGDGRADFGQILSLLRELRQSLKDNGATTPGPAEVTGNGVEESCAPGDGLIAVGADGRILSANSAAETLTGYATRELSGVPVPRINFLPTEWVQREIAAQNASPNASPSGGAEFELTRKDGSRVWVEANIWPVRRAGTTLRRHLLLRDITMRRRADESLRKREAGLRLAQQISRVGHWEWDLVGGTLDWSEEALRLLGQTPREIQPSLEAFDELIHPADRASVQQARGQAVQQGQPYIVEYRVIRPDGTECCLFEQTDVTRDANGRALRLMGTIQDITQRKQHEEQLRQLEKWEAIGRLAGGVAHDFNTVLTEIGRCAKALEASPHIHENMVEQIQGLSAAAQRATNLTWHLLAYTRKQALEFKPVDLNDLVAHVAHTLQQALDTQIQLHLNLAPNLPAVCADVNLLEQVLLNLALHSRQTILQRGQLTIETRVTEINAGYVLQQPEARPGRHVCLSITDTIHGGDTATTACLYEPFFTTRETGPATGLSLATVYGTIKQHQGWIDVFSSLGQGETFTIYLPAQSTRPEALAADGLAKPIWGGTETLLLVEDEPLLRALAQSILERYGYRVLTAGASPEALALSDQHPEPIDLLLTNWTLPEGMSGNDLGDRLRAQRPKLKLLYASAYNLSVAQSNYRLKLGVNFLPKPYSSTALAQAVRRCLDSDPRTSENSLELFEPARPTHS